MLLLKLLGLALLTQNIKTSPVKANAVDYRLPKNVLPDKYAIELTLGDPATNLDFGGKTTIFFKTTEDVQEIQLHANKLQISGVTLEEVKPEGTDNEPLEIDQTQSSLESDNTTDKIWISTLTPLRSSNEYQLTILFTGQLRDEEMYGFYKSVYNDADGVEKVLATTQFQPTYARRAFPCFDEPNFKAKFDITLIYPKKYSARGNAEIETVSDMEGDLRKTVFKTTPKMSSYLIAFLVSEFTSTEEEIDLAGGKIPHKVWSRIEAATTRNLAITVTPKIINDLETYTGVSYGTSTLTKLDQVAIPDFSAGAMENWGLITYRETALLWDEQESSNRYKQRVETVITHELAHMWFGNLKTTHWWSDVWLNEGFATYFEFHTTGRVEGTWELDKQFVAEEVHAALASDASASSHALHHEVYSPDEVSGRFSTISYGKGGSILRMVEHIISPSNFQKGIQSYIKSNQFGVATTTELWEKLNEFAANLPDDLILGQVMEAWTNKPGFPLVTVTADGNNVTLSQKRFLTSSSTEDNTTWYVPISFTTSANSINNFENTAPATWILPDETDKQITGVLENADWIVVNNKQTGFYRVKYDDVLLEKLSLALKRNNFDNIVDLNRANFVDDLLNLAKIDEYKYAKVFDILSFLNNDISYYPWYAAFAEFDVMLRRTGNEQIKNSLSTLILNMMTKLLESVPFDSADDDNQIYTHTRVLAQTWACKLGSETCITKATDEFRKYKNSATNSATKTRPDKNLKLVVYCNALRHSTNATEDWKFLWEEYRSTDLATEQVTIISALGCTKDEALLNAYLQKTITSDGGIRKQDALSVYSAVHSGNPEGVDVAFNFLTANYKEIANNYKSLNSLSSLINGIVAKFNKQSQIDALKSFIAQLTDDDSFKETAETALVSAERNLELTRSFEDQMLDYFKYTPDHAATVKFEVITLFTLVFAVYRLFY